MFGLVKEKTKQGTWFSSISDAASAFTQAMNVVEGVMSYTEMAIAAVQSCTNAVARVKKAYEAFQNMSDSGKLLSVMGMADSATRILTGNSSNTFYNATKDCLAIAYQCMGIFRADYQDHSQHSKSQDTSYFTVSFETNGGSHTNSQKIEYSKTAKTPKEPTKNKYSFAGWYSDAQLTTAFDFNTAITADITLYAKWVQISNTVTFKSNGGSSVSSQDVMIGSYATEPEAPTKEGFDFVYWCDDVECTNEFHFNTTPVTGALTLYAKWSAKEITVTFDSNGGSSVESQVIGYGDRAVFPEIPVKENAVFVMWEKAEEVDSGEKDENNQPIMTTVYSEFDFADELTEDITLYAKWFGA